MKKFKINIIAAAVTLGLVPGVTVAAITTEPSSEVSATTDKGPAFPESVYVGGQIQHVQGIAYDDAAGYMYMSFTSRFLKLDRQGNIIASIDRIQGHLGAMTFDPVGRKVYASLECKDDVIGQGIAEKLNVPVVKESVFYIAIIDVDKLTEIGADPEKGDVLKTVCVREACDDYSARFTFDGAEIEHRYGCSGIDGVTIGPEMGSKEHRLAQAGKRCLYVAYGVYGETERSDNDHQIILCYDLKSLEKYARPVVFGTIHKSGPKKPAAKYFLHSGNSVWGIQNLAYDEYTGKFIFAVYRGRKAEWPNYDLYAFSIDQKPFKALPKGVAYQKKKVETIVLDPDLGQKDEKSGISGWRFKWGSTGICSIGNGYWYISENGRDKTTKLHDCNATLYRWTGEADRPFERIAKPTE